MTNDALKYDNDKTRYDLLAPDALEQVAQVYTYGAKKYAPENWRKGMAYSRVFGAVLRHLWAFWRGEKLDSESKLPHLAHAMWGCMTLCEYDQRGMGEDDRPYNMPKTMNGDVKPEPLHPLGDLIQEAERNRIPTAQEFEGIAPAPLADMLLKDAGQEMLDALQRSGGRETE